MEDIFEGIFST